MKEYTRLTERVDGSARIAKWLVEDVDESCYDDNDSANLIISLLTRRLCRFEDMYEEGTISKTETVQEGNSEIREIIRKELATELYRKLAEMEYFYRDSRAYGNADEGEGEVLMRDIDDLFKKYGVEVRR